MELLIKESRYFSQLDEDHFFSWLQEISGVMDVKGTPQGLIVSLASDRLSKESIYDLLAIHARYNLDMRQLAQFETKANSSWFRNPQAYWYKRVFGLANT